MKFTSEGPQAVPLWIDGHPYLTLGHGLLDVVNPVTGIALRRVPLSGADEAAVAIGAARAAGSDWAARSPAERQSLLSALAQALAGLADHFAGLVGEETGADEAVVAAEIAAVVAGLEHPGTRGSSGVTVVIGDAASPLGSVALPVAEALAAGGTAVIKPSPRAPGAAYAFCELSARAGLPPGILNLVQGDEAAVEGLCAHAEVARLEYRGDAALGERIGTIAARHGKALCRGG